MSKASQHNLKLVDLLVPVSLVQLVDHIGAQLISRIVRASLGLAETEMAGAYRDNGVPIRLRDRDVSVVPVAVDVKVEGLFILRPVLLVHKILRGRSEDLLSCRLVTRAGYRVLGELLAGQGVAWARERGAEIGQTCELAGLSWSL